MAKRAPRRFGSYAAVEAANVVLVPGLALWLGWPNEPLEFVAIGLSMTATAGFLIIGAMYWRGVDERLQGRGRRAIQRALALADRAERPLLSITALAAIATVVALFAYGPTGSVIASGVLALLAALEYVNYYHRQLQHFDNAGDFKRLLKARRLRPAHMARGLANFRSR